MASRDVLLFDDRCPLCTFQTHWLSWLDWNSRLRMMPLSSPVASEWTAGIARQQLHEAIHCVTPEGRVFRGARAIRHICFMLPPLMPFGLFLYFPGLILVSEIFYRLVSRNRHILSRLFGCKTACQVLPAKSASEKTDASRSRTEPRPSDG